MTRFGEVFEDVHTFCLAQPLERLRITVDLMEVLPSHDRTAVMHWLSALPYPWCDARTALGRAPALDGLEPVLRYLNRTIPAAAVRG